MRQRQRESAKKEWEKGRRNETKRKRREEKENKTDKERVTRIGDRGK